jgi:Kef-type K+ transport system membrane component KefB
VANIFLTVNALHLFSNLGIILLLFLVGLECNLREMRAVGGWALGVAAGMLPRGEVTLIFASLGKSYGLLHSNLFTFIVIVMLLTTLMTPPLLKHTLERQVRAWCPFMTMRSRE